MKIIDCPFIDQREKYPTGCESVSAVMLLRHFGFDVTPEEFIGRCLPKAPEPVCENGVWYAADPQHFYLGDPCTDDGWGCFAPAVCKGLRTYLGDTDTYEVREVYGMTLADLCREYVFRDVPVIVFATMGMAQPREYRTWTIPETGETYTWKTPMHCLLLVGYGEGTFVFNDPLVGKNTVYPADAALFAHEHMGMQAAVLVKVK
ncbi:MAG: C39 family peptidase [Clostridia bacterium]|nr:C39 family peptidase [Clostridia bacterium]MBQ9994801.1 C39 family peptidase [Clostridia bacterium]